MSRQTFACGSCVHSQGVIHVLDGICDLAQNKYDFFGFFRDFWKRIFQALALLVGLKVGRFHSIKGGEDDLVVDKRYQAEVEDVLAELTWESVEVRHLLRREWLVGGYEISDSLILEERLAYLLRRLRCFSSPRDKR